MRTRRITALAVTAAIALAACGGDDDDAAEPAAAEAAQADEMSDDEMADEMSDDEMADEMSDDEMSDDGMADEMADDEMADDEMADEMADDEMADDEMADDEMADDEMADDMSMNDVQSLITGRSDLTVLDAAIHAVGLNDALHDEGPFTVFAPTDEAFEAYLGEMGMTVDDVLADVDGLTRLLQHHVVAGNETADMVVSMTDMPFTTLAGTELPVTVDGDTVMVGEATVIETDLTADNGVVHVIDTVLTPPGG